MSVQVTRAFLASWCDRLVASSDDARDALSRRRVNTSLSGTLFFWMRWCIRDEVHLDSRVHTANWSHITTLEGNMAKKAKKAKSAVKKTAKKTRKVAKKK
jgi:hypothetical protein